MTEKKIRESILNSMRHFIGTVEGDSKFREIVDTYNNKCRSADNNKRWGTRTNIKFLDTYGWCAANTSVAAQLAEYTTKDGKIGTLNEVVPIEMGVDDLYNIAVRNHIWQAKGNGYGAQPADLVVYKWQTGNASKPIQWHVGMIEEVHDTYFTTIEGNVGEPRQCGRKTRMKDDPLLLGVISPLYCTIATNEDPKPTNKIEDIVKSMAIGDELIKTGEGSYMLVHQDKKEFDVAL